MWSDSYIKGFFSAVCCSGSDSSPSSAPKEITDLSKMTQNKLKKRSHLNMHQYIALKDKCEVRIHLRDFKQGEFSRMSIVNTHTIPILLNYSNVSKVFINADMTPRTPVIFNEVNSILYF